MKWPATFAGVIAALVLAGCGSAPHGSITELSYVPAHRANVLVDDYTEFCSVSGSSVFCYPIWIGQHWEEQAFEAQWNAELTHCNTHAKCGREEIAITREQYDSWAIGDYYPAVTRYDGIRTVGR